MDRHGVLAHRTGTSWYPLPIAVEEFCNAWWTIMDPSPLQIVKVTSACVLDKDKRR